MTRRKRLFDVLIGSFLAATAFPFIALLALGVAINLRAFPFFVQERIGQGGRPFRFIKLRTLPTSCPQYADKYTIAAVQTTRFARFLRMTHLDELPQLFLVPLGRMSLVGPRPEMAALLHRFDPDFVSARLSMRPGCTGLWQISNAAQQLIGEGPEYDLAYLHHSTLSLDMWILFHTARRMAWPRGRPVELVHSRMETWQAPSPWHRGPTLARASSTAPADSYLQATSQSSAATHP